MEQKGFPPSLNTLRRHSAFALNYYATRSQTALLHFQADEIPRKLHGDVGTKNYDVGSGKFEKIFFLTFTLKF